MNNTIMRRIDVTASFQALSDASLVGSVTLSCPPANAADVIFLGDDGSDVPWVPGEWHTFRSINLAEVKIKGTAGDTVTIIGGTW